MNEMNIKTSRSGAISSRQWITIAREFLIDKGIAGVKVEPLARALNVTPGSFYWHFKNRPALYDALLRNWLAHNVSPFFELYDEALNDPKEQYLALAYAWILSVKFDPAFDIAVREWGRSSKKVNRLIRIVDHKRISLYENLFIKFGQTPQEAAVRARAMYYHQIGYYAMHIEEPLDKRLLLVPHYAMLFTGTNIFGNCNTADTIHTKLSGFKRKPSDMRKAL